MYLDRGQNTGQASGSDLRRLDVGHGVNTVTARPRRLRLCMWRRQCWQWGRGLLARRVRRRDGGLLRVHGDSEEGGAGFDDAVGVLARGPGVWRCGCGQAGVTVRVARDLGGAKLVHHGLNVHGDAQTTRHQCEEEACWRQRPPHTQTCACAHATGHTRTHAGTPLPPPPDCRREHSWNTSTRTRAHSPTRCPDAVCGTRLRTASPTTRG